MSAANSSGGVMGKIIDAQSIVVASTATRWYGHEGDILRYVFLHSLVLAALAASSSRFRRMSGPLPPWWCADAMDTAPGLQPIENGRAVSLGQAVLMGRWLEGHRS